MSLYDDVKAIVDGIADETLAEKLIVLVVINDLPEEQGSEDGGGN